MSGFRCLLRLGNHGFRRRCECQACALLSRQCMHHLSILIRGGAVGWLAFANDDARIRGLQNTSPAVHQEEGGTRDELATGSMTGYSGFFGCSMWKGQDLVGTLREAFMVARASFPPGSVRSVLIHQNPLLDPCCGSFSLR